MRFPLDFHKAPDQLYHDILIVKMWTGNLEKSDAVQHTQQFGALYWQVRIPECLPRAHVEEGAWDLGSADPDFNLRLALPSSSFA